MRLFSLSVAALWIVSCSSPKEQIGPVDIFSFDIPAGTSADSVSAAIKKAFLKRYAFIDTSRVASGEVVPADIVSYDSITKTVKCVSGYYIVVKEDPKPDPNFVGDYFGSPSKIFFFTGTGNHYEVTNRPIVTPGSNEDTQEELTISLDYKGNGTCSMFGVKINQPLQIVGIMTNQHITFYYWDELSHRLRPSIVFETEYADVSMSRTANRKGEIAFVPGNNAFYDIQYKGSGDSTYTAYYVWSNGIYQDQHRPEDQSGYVLITDSIPGVRYPLFTSNSNPRAADAVNKALQLEDFGELITENNRNKFFPEGDTIYRQYLIKRVNKNMLLVSTAISYGEGDAYAREYYQRYFNARTGDEIRIADLINSDSSKSFARMVTRELVRAMQRGGVGSSKCVSLLRKAWDEDRVLMGIRYSNGPRITFDTPKCNWEASRSSAAYDLWRGELPFFDVEPYLTEYFVQLVRDDVFDPNVDRFARTWHGTLDGQTAVTFILRSSANDDAGSYGGYVVYNDIGTPVNFSASSNGDTLLLTELDDTGKEQVGSFQASLQDGKLAGTYTKKDGTVMQFEAVSGK